MPTFTFYRHFSSKSKSYHTRSRLAQDTQNTKFLDENILVDSQGRLQEYISKVK